jgi:hypothetical protein
MAVTGDQVRALDACDEDNVPGDTIHQSFRDKWGIPGTGGKFPLPPRDHPDAKKFARAVLSRAHQAKGIDPAKLAARVRKAKSYLGEDRKESATPWRDVTWVDVAKPISGGYARVRPLEEELFADFRKRCPSAVPLARALKLSERDRSELVVRPRVIRLNESASGTSVMRRLSEASDVEQVASLAKVPDVLLIRSGPGNKGDRNWYTPACLRKAVETEAFEGARCFYNHAGPMEEREQPGGDVKNLAGWFSDTKVKEYDDPERGRTTGLFADFHPKVGDPHVLSILRTCSEYAKRYPGQDFAGLSINAGGVGEPDTIEGEQWTRIDEILKSKSNSVDIVTNAGAGGTFIAVRG